MDDPSLLSFFFFPSSCSKPSQFSKLFQSTPSEKPGAVPFWCFPCSLFLYFLSATIISSSILKKKPEKNPAEILPKMQGYDGSWLEVFTSSTAKDAQNSMEIVGEMDWRAARSSQDVDDAAWKCQRVLHFDSSPSHPTRSIPHQPPFPHVIRSIYCPLKRITIKKK